MKNRKLLGLLTLLILNFLVFIPQVQAQSFSIGIEEDRLYVFKIKSFDEDYFEPYNISRILGPNASVGAMWAFKVSSIQFSDLLLSHKDGQPCEGWGIFGLIWHEWVLNETIFDDEDKATILASQIYADPKDCGSNMTAINLLTSDFHLLYYLPTPVEDYLAGLAISALAPNITHFSRTLKFTGLANHSSGSHIISRTQTWDASTGVLRNVKLTNEGTNEILYEIGLVSHLENTISFGMKITIFLLIGTISIIILITRKTYPSTTIKSNM
jgi:hypothetical protein